MTGFLRRVLSPYRGLLILVILLQLGQSFLTMYLPTINSRVIDYGVANADAAYIMHQGILMLKVKFRTERMLFCQSSSGEKYVLNM